MAVKIYMFYDGGEKDIEGMYELNYIWYYWSFKKHSVVATLHNIKEKSVHEIQHDTTVS